MQFSILSFSRFDHKSPATWFLSLGYGEPSALLVKPKKKKTYHIHLVEVCTKYQIHF